MRTRRHLDEDELEAEHEAGSSRSAEAGQRVADQDASGLAGMLRLQQEAGNAAVSSLFTSGLDTAAPVAQRSPGPPGSETTTRPAGVGPGRGPTVEELPGTFDPAKTPGGTAFSAAKALVDGARAQLDRIALEAEREAALSALMAKEPSIYDTLHANPGKGMVVNLNFKSTDPETLPQNRPPEYKPKLELRFLGVSVSDPFELPEPKEGPALTPSAAGPGEVGYGWRGHTLSMTVRPVRPDPEKPRQTAVIESVETLLGYMNLTFLPLPLVAGQLKTGRRSFLPGATSIVNRVVVEVNALGTRLLVLEEVANAAADELMSRGRSEMLQAVTRKRESIETLQARLENAVGEGGTSRWWSDRSFRIDPHLLDSARAHLAAATGYLKTDDLASSWESLSACDDQLDLVRNQLYAYETNDFSDPTRRSPTAVQDLL
jgi:hypothetical protein